jgi:hypothetical protein
LEDNVNEGTAYAFPVLPIRADYEVFFCSDPEVNRLINSASVRCRNVSFYVSEDQFEIMRFSKTPSCVNQCVFFKKVKVWEEELGDESWKEV